ncbi:membrane protein [Pontibacillus litoralis JSM 072002]|uniref:Membrane protein n=1 Tax=Pontibacillus litoralis JSM 072002 TaxID=1385512 RepID=A0A0A5G756_9BACI|nr:membrane protein [Pontibacillus litoralis JSM 072002]
MTYGIGTVGGMLFATLNLPLPWILGAVTALLLYKTLAHASTRSSTRLKNISFALLGIQIGSYFTEDTFANMSSYVLPYIALTILLIAISLWNGYIIGKRMGLTPDVSLIGSIPGGLSAATALSDSLQSNTAMVSILHTIRLITLLFVVPFIATHWLNGASVDQVYQSSMEQGEDWTIICLLIAYALAQLLRERIPASYVMIPMLFVAVLKTAGVPVFTIPTSITIVAQVILGVYLGHTIMWKDILTSMKVCAVYFVLTMWLLFVAFLLSYVFHIVTDVDIPTSFLSIVPGGLVEMALVAQSVGADPTMVGSLQMIRLLLVVTLVPFLLKMLLNRARKIH